MPFTFQRGDTPNRAASSLGDDWRNLIYVFPDGTEVSGANLDPTQVPIGTVAYTPAERTTTEPAEDEPVEDEPVVDEGPQTPETSDTDYGEPGWWTAAQRFEQVFGYQPSKWSSAEKINFEVQRALENPERWDPDYVPPPDPDPETDPGTPEPVDYKARVKALYPFLPDNLVSMFADEWADTGDPELALATVRASNEYEQAFPGIKRDDGTLRMSEAEWFSTREAYTRLFQDFGLNPELFQDRFTGLMEGDVSPQELAGRLGAAYEQIANAIPEVREQYAAWFGEEGMSDQAIFASFIDPDIGDAILNRRISIAQVGGEGLARGFDVEQSLAERLVSGGLDRSSARDFFVAAEGQLQTLDQLARRHRDPDDTFDLEEFAEANVFGDAEQTRRIRRLLRAEASQFGDQVGQIRTQQSRLTGLSPQ